MHIFTLHTRRLCVRPCLLRLNAWLGVLACALALLCVPCYAIFDGYPETNIRFDTISMEELEFQGDRIGIIQSIAQGAQGYMWFGGSNGLARYDGRNFRIFQRQENTPFSLASNEVTRLLVDHNNQLWVATRHGLFVYQQQREGFSRFNPPNAPAWVKSMSITSVALDSNNRLYIGTEQGVVEISADRQSFQLFTSRDANEKPATNRVQALLYDQGRILVGTLSDGLYMLDAQRGDYALYPMPKAHAKALRSVGVFDMLRDQQGRLWLASMVRPPVRLDPDGSVHFLNHAKNPEYSAGLRSVWRLFERRNGEIWLSTDNAGIAIFDEASQQFVFHRHDPYASHSISSNQVRSLYEDNQGDIWLGTFTSEINHLNRAKSNFITLQYQPNKSSISHNGTLVIAASQQGGVWVGTEKGLNYFEPQSQQFTVYTTESTQGRLVSDTVLTVVEDSKGTLWLGTTQGGIIAFDPQSQSFSNKTIQEKTLRTTGVNFIWNILLDEDNLWAGTLFEGLFKLDRNGKVLEHYQSDDENPATLPSNYIYRTLDDGLGNLWLGTMDGLSILNKRDKTLQHVELPDKPPDNNTAYNINSLFMDSLWRVWVGVQGEGIYVFHRDGSFITLINAASGLQSAVASSFVEDTEGQIWAGTQNGIARINPQTFQVTMFQKQHGVANNNHNRNASLITPQGDIYIGSSGGITVFNPKRFGPAAKPSPVIIQSLQVNNIALEPGPQNGLLPQSISQTKQLTLNHQHTTFSFGVAHLNMRTAKFSQFSYYLEGLEDNWGAATRSDRAVYTNIPAGRYIFRLKAVDEHGLASANEIALPVHILPAPWLTWWAYSVYGFVLLALLAMLYKHKQKQLELTQERALNTELRKVAKLKNTFLANTSHELRTPLNGVLGLAEQLVDYGERQQDNTVLNCAKNIQSSGKRLLNTINDVLDFSKLEAQSLTLQRQPLNILQVTSEVLLLLPIPKHIQILNQLNPCSPNIYADANRLRQILLNIVGNAIKYTQEGRITFKNSFDQHMMTLEVQDTGLGIDADIIERVFDSLNHKSHNHGEEQGGIGLGLSITKQLIELHGGEIDVHSNKGEGTRVRFTLPITCDKTTTGVASVAQPADQTSAVTSAPAEAALHSKPLILVVDDEAINRMVLIGMLKGEYDVIEAETGKAALEQLHANPEVVLVLMDIMMPEMNGFEACAAVRRNFNRQQLPVIFVTAREVETDKSTAQKVGGNGFLSKPVNRKTLLSEIKAYLTG